MTSQPPTRTSKVKKPGTKGTSCKHPAEQLWANPEACRLWAYQQRHHEALTHDSCLDLIESIREGGQKFAVIARIISNESETKYEIVAGERRHFAVSWLRANEDPQLKLLIEVRALSDEEAFQVADLENRNRKDLSDFERSCSLRRALGEIFGDNQSRMAAKLGVSNSWLSRYLEIGSLPHVVRTSFGSDREILISHVARLAPALRKSEGREIRKRAAALQANQADRKSRRLAPMPASEVVATLLRPSEQAANSTSQEILDAGHRVVARWARSKGGIKLELPGLVVVVPEDFVTAIRQFINNLLASKTCT